MRVFAIIALCRLDSPLETQLAELRRLARDENALVRQQVTRELRTMGESARPALPELQALQNDKDDEVRQTAAYLVKTLTPRNEDTRE